jgi:dTMP kinase
MRGVFITFEGIDGSGKSTQLEKAAQYLASLGRELEITLEPGGTQIGQRIRAFVLSGESSGISAEAESILYAADRAEHVAKVIRPAILAGKVVLCDRYTDSTLAFQGFGRGLDLEFLEELNRLATGGLVADVTLVLDVDADIAKGRLDARPRSGTESIGIDRFHEEAQEFHRRVRQGYLTLAAQDPERIYLVDSSGPADEAHRRVLEIIEPVILSRDGHLGSKI